MPSETALAIKERTTELCEQFAEAGVDARPYSHQPVGRDVFTAGMHLNIARLWNGTAETDLRTDKRRRQGVLNVAEGARTVEHTFSLGSWPTKAVETPHPSPQSMTQGPNGELIYYFQTTPRALPADKQLKTMATSQFPVHIPGAKLSVQKINKTERDLRGESHTDVTATVRATVEATITSMLVGWDETAQFIAALPTRADSVKEAHDLLRGDVPLNARRQGEWFFVPITEQERELVLRRLGTHGLDLNDSWNPGLESGSTHTAPCRVSVNGQRYAIGAVVDRRKGHHAPLILKDWHRIVRNAEIAVTRMARRQRYWD